MKLKAQEALKAAKASLAHGDKSRESALQLIDESEDVLVKLLDAKVRRLSTVSQFILMMRSMVRLSPIRRYRVVWLAIGKVNSSKTWVVCAFVHLTR